MTLGVALDAAISGLNVSQGNLAVLSRNIANINTEGYSRQVITQSAQVVAGVGVGAKLENISRVVDDYLITQTREQFSELSKAKTLESYLSRVQVFYGQPEKGNSISNGIDEFFSSLNSLATSPDQLFTRTDVVTKGNELARRISSLALNLEKTRFQADQDIKAAVETVNDNIKALATINDALQYSKALGTPPPPELLDQRDMFLRKIAEVIEISPSFTEDGKVTLQTPGGVELLNVNQFKLTFSPAASEQSFINNSSNGAISVTLLDKEGNLTTNSQTLVSGGTSDVVTTLLRSGKLKALLEVRDIEIPKMLEQLDRLADVLRNKINAIHNDGAGFPPPNSLTGTRQVLLSDQRVFSGTTIIAVLDSNGNPVASPYPDETYYRPLKLDLSTLDSGSGAGKPDVQTIIDEINWHYGPPSRRVKLGNMYDIKLASTSDAAATGGNFSFNFELDNDTANQANVEVTAISITGGGGAVTGSLDIDVNGGAKSRQGSFTANALGGAGPWDIQATFQVTDNITGAVTTDTMTWRITAAASGLRNDRYTFTDATLPTASIVTPLTNQRLATASLVNASGNTVGASTLGFLKIAAHNSTGGVAISEQSSKDEGALGLPSSATNRGFSGFFQLNDFFSPNTVLDQVKNSAVNLAVRSDLILRPSLVSTGELTLSKPPADPLAKPAYTYELGSGGNQTAKRMGSLQNTSVSFAAVSTLPTLVISLSNYSGQILTYSSTRANSTAAISEQHQLLFDGLEAKRDSMSSVNIDEELANTVSLQNAYKAATQVINLVKELFEDLINGFGR